MNIAVTGDHGFIGSHMTRLLQKKGHNVFGVGRQTCDLTDLSSTLKTLKNMDYVFHFAADMGGVGYFSVQQYFPFVHNARIDLVVLEACRLLEIPLFYPSSACIYPTNRQTTEGLKEDDIIPANPDQMYGWEKLMITKACDYLPNTRVGIFHTIFGTGQDWKGDKAKFPPAIVYKTIRLKKHGIPIEIWGDGEQRRTFLYISDAVQKIYEVAFAKGYWGPVNISTDEVVSIRQAADYCCEIANVSPNYI